VDGRGRGGGAYDFLNRGGIRTLQGTACFGRGVFAWTDASSPVADAYDPIPLDFTTSPLDEMWGRAHAFRAQMSQRRSVLDFSGRPVPRGLIAEAVRTAGTAPSGAHRQPWQFVAVENPDLKSEIKSEIREAAEEEGKCSTRIG